MELGLLANNEEFFLLNGLVVWFLSFVDDYDWDFKFVVYFDFGNETNLGRLVDFRGCKSLINFEG